MNLGLARILVTDHGLLDMLDDVAGSYQDWELTSTCLFWFTLLLGLFGFLAVQAFLIDSGALYVVRLLER